MDGMRLGGLEIVGCSDGGILGAPVGAAVGVSEGEGEGAGDSVGAAVGFDEGAAVIVGAIVGPSDGEGDGAGDSVGEVVPWSLTAVSFVALNNSRTVTPDCSIIGKLSKRNDGISHAFEQGTKMSNTRALIDLRIAFIVTVFVNTTKRTTGIPVRDKVREMNAPYKNVATLRSGEFCDNRQYIQNIHLYIFIIFVYCI
jgi:hypothetical protein